LIPLPAPALRDGQQGILLRPWGTSPDDAEALVSAWTDPYISAETRPPEERDFIAAAKWISGEAERRQRDLALDLVIADISPEGRRSGENAVLGEVGLASFDEKGRAEIGFWLAGRGRGRGVATVAVQLLSTWALAPSGLALQQLWARARPGHRPAEGVLGRAGYTRLGEVGGRAIWSCAAPDRPSGH
jgi:RimJ/RimL family protein N-acetyltransferase